MKNKDGGEGGGGLINFLPLKRGCSSKKKVKKCLRPKKTVRFTSWTIDNVRVYYSVVFVKHSLNNKRKTHENMLTALR